MFMESLTTLGILECIQKHPVAFKQIFCNFEKALAAEDIEQTFVLQLDKPGSNRCIKQKTAVMHALERLSMQWTFPLITKISI
jgi:hypothetical protein